MLEGWALSDKKFQLDSLDGLRGFAVLIVFRFMENSRFSVVA